MTKKHIDNENLDEYKEYLNNKYIALIVKPNSKKTVIEGYDNNKNALIVSVKSKAEDNKANIEIIKFFSKLLGKKVFIKSGLRSREKLLKIE
ncbi:MAG: DUF167 domain-containing protein [Candidatus Woesearchaeota archaeon]